MSVYKPSDGIKKEFQKNDKQYEKNSKRTAKTKGTKKKQKKIKQQNQRHTKIYAKHIDTSISFGRWMSRYVWKLTHIDKDPLRMNERQGRRNTKTEEEKEES